MDKKEEEKSDFIVLMKKADFIDFFKNGSYKASACPYIKIEGGISQLKDGSKEADALFKKANPIEYSIDYLLLHVNAARIRELGIKEVVAIYALDESAYSIGLDLNPPVILNRPILQKSFEHSQIDNLVDRAINGVQNVGEIFGIDKWKDIRKTSAKCICIRESCESVYYESVPEGNKSPWTYLLRYQRHENYPKDMRGYFLDALHVSYSISVSKTFHGSIMNSATGREISGLEAKSYGFNEWAEWVRGNKKLITKIKDYTKNKYFLQIAALFLKLRDVFQDGIFEDEKYNGKPLYEFTESVNANYVKEYLSQALFLLGASLGWDNTYILMYKRWNLPILKNDGNKNQGR